MNVAPDDTDYRDNIHLTSESIKAEQHHGFCARLAVDYKTKRDAYRLRYLCYHSKGYINTRRDGEFSDCYDMSSNNKTIVIYDAGQAVASIRLCCMDLSSPDPTAKELPLAHVFPDEFANLLKPNGRAIELNRLVRHPARAQSQGLVYLVFRLADFVIRQHNPEFIASCVRSNHVGFYKRLRFNHVAGPKMYTGLNFMTNFLVCRRASFEVVRRAIPMLHISSAACSLYDGLLRGETIPVFDYE